MGENTKIEWTDHTFNPWWGCSHVHPGCKNCYAEAWAKRFGVKWGPNGVRRVASEAQWKEPLKWNRAAEKTGVRAKVFCASMADVFEDWTGPMLNTRYERLYDVGEGWWYPESDINQRAYPGFDAADEDFHLTMNDVRRRLVMLIDETPHLDWLLLTKRPENIRRMWPTEDDGANGRLAEAIFGGKGKLVRRRDNVWLGTSVSDQASADKQTPELLKCRDLSPVLFLSIEPLLGPVNFAKILITGKLSACENVPVGQLLRGELPPFPWLDWVIVGGESGPSARAMSPDWVTSIRRQCQEGGIPFFFKQWGEWMPLHGTGQPDNEDEELTPWTWIDDRGGCHQSGSWPDEKLMIRRGKKYREGRMLDGREWSEFPEVIHDGQ